MERNKKTWTISKIEALTEREAQQMAEEMTEVKGFNVYFVDFGDTFGYSCLVFKNDHHIYYANDYQLHYITREKEELKQKYIKGLNNKLYTEEEILEPVKDYEDYTSKSYYLHNYYGMQVDYTSIFRINPSEEEEAAFRKKIQGAYYNPVAFAYMDDLAFVEHHIELNEALEMSRETISKSYEFIKTAFLDEMYNHEYGINWQADFDVLSCFGDINYHDDNLEEYFRELNFTEIQKKAYLDARRQYYKETEDQL